MPTWFSLMLLSLGAAAAVTMGGFAFAAFGQKRQADSRRARLTRFADRAGSIASGRPENHAAITQSLARAKTRTPELDDWARRILPGAAAVEQQLLQSGRDVSIGHLLVAMVAVTALTMIVALVFGAPIWLALAGSVAVGQIVPRTVLKRWRSQRLKKFTLQFPDAIDLAVRALRAGLPLSEALRSVSDEFPEPTGGEFKQVVGWIAIGLSLEDALWDMTRRVDSPELRFFVISIATQRQTGGNLGETLANLAAILRSRSHLAMKIKAMTSEARTSAMVLGGLPFAVGALLLLTNPDYISPMLHDPRGWMMLGTGAAMMTVGSLIMAKLVSFEV